MKGSNKPKHGCGICNTNGNHICWRLVALNLMGTSALVALLLSFHIINLLLSVHMVPKTFVQRNRWLVMKWWICIAQMQICGKCQYKLNSWCALTGRCNLGNSPIPCARGLRSFCISPQLFVAFGVFSKRQPESRMVQTRSRVARLVPFQGISDKMMEIPWNASSIWLF